MAYSSLGQLEKQGQLLEKALAIPERDSPTSHELRQRLQPFWPTGEAAAVAGESAGDRVARVANKLTNPSSAHSKLVQLEKQWQLLERALAIAERESPTR